MCVFDGIMDARVYVTILEKPLIPFLCEVYPDHHRFMQDNDPKHTSRRAWEFFEQNRINWWQTPPESPDLNPIENLWHVLKEFLRREVKPMSKQELVTGIEQFWKQSLSRIVQLKCGISATLLRIWLAASSVGGTL